MGRSISFGWLAMADIKENGTREKDVTQAKTIRNFLETHTSVKSSCIQKIIIEVKYWKQKIEP